MSMIYRCMTAVWMLAIAAGCVTTERRAEMGAAALLNGLEAERVSCGKAKDYARQLQAWGRGHEPGNLDRVMKLLGRDALCEDARIELAGVMRRADDRSRRDALVDVLSRVDVKQDELADELALVIVSFCGSREEAFAFIAAHIGSRHIAVRYGCVDLLYEYFKPTMAPEYSDRIIAMLTGLLGSESDAAVAELACQALAEVGLSTEGETRRSVKRTLQDISNDTTRIYTSISLRSEVPRKKAVDVLAMAARYDSMM